MLELPKKTLVRSNIITVQHIYIHGTKHIHPLHLLSFHPTKCGSSYKLFVFFFPFSQETLSSQGIYALCTEHPHPFFFFRGNLNSKRLVFTLPKNILFFVSSKRNKVVSTVVQKLSIVLMFDLFRIFLEVRPFFTVDNLYFDTADRTSFVLSLL